jgi:hypothetical protein
MNIITSKQIQNYNTAMAECGCCMSSVSEISKGIYCTARLNRNTPTRWPELTKPNTVVKCPQSPHKGRGNNHHTYYRKANITCAIFVSSSEEDSSSWMLKHTSVCSYVYCKAMDDKSLVTQ